MKKRFLSILLALTMVFSLLPMTATAVENDNVYVTVSYDDQFVEGENGDMVAYAAISLKELEKIDLDSYGLSDYLYDKDGDGTYDVTALHLYIYTHENLFGLDWADVYVSGGAGSIFFESGLFGFSDCNLNYFYNGVYPEVDGWGVTADQLTLKAGDFLDIAAYTSWAFYSDSATGFHYFADAQNEITHNYSSKAGEELAFKLVRSYSSMGSDAMLYDEAGYTVYYGTEIGNPSGSVTTDGNGEGSVTFSSTGTWYLWCDGGYGSENPDDIVSSPASAVVNVEGEEAVEKPENTLDVSSVLNATMAQLASTVTEPAFGTNAGEWTVLSLARGEYFNVDHKYFTDYYDRIVATVNEKAAAVNQNGALHASKSTDNSRLIIALSSIGKDATAVGNWNLIKPYDDFNWIKNQGINGVIYALIALDTNAYQTSDTTIREQCVDYILEKQLSDGGWALSGSSYSTDVTAMALQALYPYRNEASVQEAANKAFTCLSDNQQTSGGFLYGGDETLESAAQVIVACATWGINPDTDSRYVKNGNSVIDALLSHYVEEEAAFKHVAAGEINDMATDQACYALVAYKRFLNEQTSLYDMSDVSFEEKSDITVGDIKAILGLPQQISYATGETFYATISLDKWDNEKGFKLIDFMLEIPNGVAVTAVTPSERLGGGEINFHLETETGKLRAVYFDANEHSDITLSGTTFPAELFRVEFEIISEEALKSLDIAVSGMSLKTTSDSTDNESMLIIDTTEALGTIEFISGISYSAICLYTGDDVDLIPSTKKAVAISVAGVSSAGKLVYNDGTNEYEFKYNSDISEKTGVVTYVALVESSISTAAFVDEANLTLTAENGGVINFGDSNGDEVINAQDALAAVDMWLRKTEEPSDEQIIALNVNGDSRINTYDALGIVEKFVDGSDYLVVTNAANMSTNN